jgi:hypothetical protein
MEGRLKMDIALAIDYLVSGAEYTGTFEKNIQEEYTGSGFNWLDSREMPTWEAIVAEDTILQLELSKDAKRDQVRSMFDYEVDKPVNILDENDETFSWNGGFDSAMRIDAALRLTQKIPSYTTCVVHDYNNEPHEYTFSGIDIITTTLGGAFQQQFAKKENLMVQIEVASGIEEVNNIKW